MAPSRRRTRQDDPIEPRLKVITDIPFDPHLVDVIPPAVARRPVPWCHEWPEEEGLAPKAADVACDLGFELGPAFVSFSTFGTSPQSPSR
jgi:hypothetical protein